MNRTFYAFGMLLALLVVTTWAVNSGSRSTTRQRMSPAESGRFSTRHPGGTTFIIVLPEAPLPPTANQIRAASVVEAERVASPFETLVSVDCSVHDGPAFVAASLTDEVSRTLPAEEMVELFTTLSVPQAQRRSLLAAPFRMWNSRSLAMYVRGLQHWLSRQTDRLPLVWLARQLLADKVAGTEPVSWNDYATLIDRLPRAEAAPVGTTIQLAEAAPVQSGHWLLHSAASSLNRLALLLELTAQRLERTEKLVNLAAH